MIGATLSRYHITAKLGEGGNGSVWLAEDTLLGRPVALKLLAPQLAVSESARQRFIREARAASRLEHSGIAAVHDAGEAEGHVFIAYQFIEGQTLAARLARGPLPLPDLLRFARGTAEALAHAHGRDVLHRDLTAGNVMLRPDGSPVIVDFGLARTRGDATLTSAGATLGTAPYLAPEQWRGEPGDARTDLWSLGVVLYYAATGQQPFVGDTTEAVMYRVLNDEPVKPAKFRPELPSEFERLVLRLLEKDARDRLASAAELAAVLARIAGAEPEATHAPANYESPVSRAKRWWRKQARYRIGSNEIALVAIVVLVSVTAILMVRQRLESRRELVLGVLPMRIAGGDSSEAAVTVEALGEELVTRFHDASRLRVLPWVTTGRPGTLDSPLQAIAHEMHADYLLTGSIRANDEDSRVHSELVEGRNGTVIWSKEFSTSPGTLTELQGQIVLAVAEKLTGSLDHASLERLRTGVARNPEAYEYFIRGANAWHSGDPERQNMARQFLEQAVTLDSTLAPAWVALGGTHLEGIYRGVESDTAAATARRCFERAETLRPGLPVAERGLIRLGYEFGGNDQAELMRDIAARALQRDPQDVDQLTTAAWGFTLAFLPELAVPAIEHGLRLDPGNQGLAWYRVLACAWSGQPARAIAAGADYTRRFGEDPEVYSPMGGSAMRLRRYADAVTYFGRAVELTGAESWHYSKNSLVRALRLNGDSLRHAKVSRQVIEELQARRAANPLNNRLVWDLADAYAEAGDPRPLLRLLGRLHGPGTGPPAGDVSARAEDQWVFSMQIAEAMARAGHVSDARGVLKGISPDGEGGWSTVRDTVGIPDWDPDPAILELRRTPEYLALIAAQDEQRLALYNKYQPIVAAALPNEPDAPKPRTRWPRNPLP